MSKQWRSLISYSTRKKIQHKAREHLLNGKMMRHTYSNMDYLHTWSRTNDSLKILMIKIGNKLLKLFQLKIQRSAIRDGCSFRN